MSVKSIDVSSKSLRFAREWDTFLIKLMFFEQKSLPFTFMSFDPNAFHFSDRKFPLAFAIIKPIVSSVCVIMFKQIFQNGFFLSATEGFGPTGCRNKSFKSYLLYHGEVIKLLAKFKNHRMLHGFQTSQREAKIEAEKEWDRYKRK